MVAATGGPMYWQRTRSARDISERRSTFTITGATTMPARCCSVALAATPGINSIVMAFG